MSASSLFFGAALLAEGWAHDVRIEIADGRIAAIVAGDVRRPGEECFAVGIPGLANLHSHAFQRGMAGLAEVRGPTPDSFWSWREVMYHFLGALTPDDVEAFAALAYAEMLESGFTRVGEFHYLHHDPAGRPYAQVTEMAGRIVAAAAETGIGLCLLPVLYAHGGFGGVPPSSGQRRFLCTPDAFAKLVEDAAGALKILPDATIGVAPHSLRAVTPEALADAVALAAGRPVHIHVAEQLREVEECLAWSGARPVEWLLDHADVGAGWCIIHATHMTEQETTRLARSGAVAGLCPITEASLGDGIFNAPWWLAAGGRYGIGTDSNVRIDAAAELRQLEYAQRLGTHARNVFAAGAGRGTGRSLFDAARTGGAQALASGPAALETGAAADMVALDTRDMSLALRNDDGWLDGWIFSADRAVDTVWRRGRAVVRQGRHLARESIERRYLASLRRLLAA